MIIGVKIVAFSWTIKSYCTKPATIHELKIATETECTQYQFKRFLKFAVVCVCIIRSALNKMVISLMNNYSVMFAILSVHVISSVRMRMWPSQNTITASLLRGKTSPMSVLIMTLNSNAGALGNAEYPFIAIASRSTLVQSGSTW